MNIRLIASGMMMFALWSSPSWAAPQKCDGSDIANGPFQYAVTGTTQAFFNGAGGGTVAADVTITAPSPKDDTSSPNVFPGQGALNACAPNADAEIGVLEIQKVADADGNSITPEDIDLGSALGASLLGAIYVNPDAWDGFIPGASVNVEVVISNPNVPAADYGTYTAKLAAKADGFGIGVGPGVTLTLTLAAAAVTDTTPPVVTVTKPVGDEILGVIPVEVTAYDPLVPDPGATGVANVAAMISSVGNGATPPVRAVVDVAIPLLCDKTFVVAAPDTVTCAGSYTPTGGAVGGAGMADGSAFTPAARSGIGTYTITAGAVDGAGNLGTGSKTFKVNYDMLFTKEQGASGAQCTGSSTNSSRGNCSGQFKFTVHRSNVTSDGAFMFDKTVEVDIVRSDNTVIKTHVYGTASPETIVKIDATDPSPANWFYQTTFKRGDIYTTVPNTPSNYTAKVYFLDVDGNRVLQATSNSVSF